MTESAAAIARARRLLTPPERRVNAWGTMLAATVAAGAAVLMAGVMVLGPGVDFSQTPPAAVAD